MTRTKRADVSAKSYSSRAVVVPLLLPVKTVLKLVPSLDTAIWKSFVRTLPRYQAIANEQRVFAAPRSSCIHEPLPRFDHRVPRLPSSVFAGTLPSLPIAVTAAGDSALHPAATALPNESGAASPANPSEQCALVVARRHAAAPSTEIRRCEAYLRNRRPSGSVPGSWWFRAATLLTA